MSKYQLNQAGPASKTIQGILKLMQETEESVFFANSTADLKISKNQRVQNLSNKTRFLAMKPFIGSKNLRTFGVISIVSDTELLTRYLRY